MEVTETQVLPETLGEECEVAPDSTSALPVVEPPARSRLHRATNLLALGQHHEAAALCREELEDYPESVDAYALLAMAEEQAGHRALAVELLEELLRLDPTRTAEARHLEELRRELAELQAEQPSPEEKEEQIRRLQPVAMIVLLGAAVCLLASLTLLIVVRHRAGVARERYQANMQAGDYYWQYGMYAEAMGWYAQALSIAPKDKVARDRYARAVQASRMSGSWQPTTPAPPITIDPNANPFAPVPIGPQPTTGQPGGAGGFPSATATPGNVYPAPPSVTGTDRTGGGNNLWNQTEPTPTPPGGVIGPPPPPPPPPTGESTPATGDPIQVGSGESPGAPATGASGAGTGETTRPRPPGEIKVETVDRPRPRTDSLAQAENLRAEGQRLYNAGQYGAAAKSLRAAVSAYQNARTEHPERQSAIDRTIQSLQAQIKVCETRSS